MALTAATQEVMFLRQLLQEMGHEQTAPTKMYDDNQGSLALCRSRMTTTRTKHIDVRYHFCREKVESGDVEVLYCPTEDMWADVLTKPLAAPRHARLASAIMVGAAGR